MKRERSMRKTANFVKIGRNGKREPLPKKATIFFAKEID